MLALIAAAALAAADVPPASSDDNRQAYQAAKAAAGRSPDDQVRLAYWCEAHGLTAERMRHLAQAVLADPNNATARGLLGLVSRANRWVRPDAVADQVKADDALAKTLQEYDAKRSGTPYTADGQWTLGLWAEEHGLTAQAKAHFTATVRLDPKRDLAWKRLGYKRVNNRWTTDAEMAANKVDADAQKAAEAKWRPLLEKWKAMLGKSATRGEAEAGLLTVTDPRAVRLVEHIFLAGANPNQAVALRILGQIDSAAASRLITTIAILGDDPNVRRAATEILRQRDPRDYADLLVRAIRERIEYEVQRVNGPGSVGQLLLKGSKQKVQRLYATPAVPNYLAWLTQINDGAPTMTFSYQGQVTSKNQVVKSQNMSYDNFANYKPPAAQLQTDPNLQGQVQFAQAHEKGLYMDWLGTTTSSQNTHSQDQLHRFKAHVLEHISPGTFWRNNAGWSVNTFEDSSTPFTTTTTIPIAAMVNEYQKTAVVAEQQLESDVTMLNTYNSQVNESNDRVTSVLRSVSGADYGTDVPAWTGWLVNLSGYAMTPQSQGDTPTFTVNVPLAYQPQAIPIMASTGQSGPTTHSNIHSTVTPFAAMYGGDCFAAGTLVRTLTGPRAIETLHMGDMVLTQSTNSGALNYQPILLVHHNPPSPTFRVKLGDDTIVTSPFHRFWKAGQGWVLARDIRAGDRLRLLSGTAVVEESTVGPTELVYNLDIAEDADFFAGASAVLVHDNTLLDSRLVPFDLPQADPKAVAAR